MDKLSEDLKGLQKAIEDTIGTNEEMTSYLEILNKLAYGMELNRKVKETFSMYSPYLHESTIDFIVNRLEPLGNIDSLNFKNVDAVNKTLEMILDLMSEDLEDLLKTLKSQEEK